MHKSFVLLAAMLALFLVPGFSAPATAAPLGPKAKKACNKLKNLYKKARSAHRAFRTRHRAKIKRYSKLLRLHKRGRTNTKQKAQLRTLKRELQNLYRPVRLAISRVGTKAAIIQNFRVRPKNPRWRRRAHTSGRMFMRSCGFRRPTFRNKTQLKAQGFFLQKSAPAMFDVPLAAFDVPLAAFDQPRGR